MRRLIGWTAFGVAGLLLAGSIILAIAWHAVGVRTGGGLKWVRPYEVRVTWTKQTWRPIIAIVFHSEVPFAGGGNQVFWYLLPFGETQP